MSTILPNGTVLPSGLLGRQGYETSLASFNQSYKNTGIKAGLVVNSYAANDPANISKLCTEYDVQTIEQFENKGSTSILYKNCLSSQGFGSLADFLEFTLRSKTSQTNTGFPTFSDQNGAIVLIQCLDNIGSKAIVISSLIHPDRPTTITTTAPQLSGEYNGVKIRVNSDGSTSLDFQGATDNNGKIIDTSQGLTSIDILTDGSFQIQHSTITFRLDKSGTASLKANKDLEMAITGNVSITCNGDATVNAKGTVKVIGKEIDFNIDNPKPENGILTSASSGNVVDYITGIPLQPSLTTFGDV